MRLIIYHHLLDWVRELLDLQGRRGINLLQVIEQFLLLSPGYIAFLKFKASDLMKMIWTK